MRVTSEFIRDFCLACLPLMGIIAIVWIKIYKTIKKLHD